jgi:hypothetical protein
MRTVRALLLALLPASLAMAQLITSSNLPTATLGQPYSTQLQCTSCQGYTFGLVNGTGNLPPGLSISPGGVISGIPSQVGTYTFNIGLFSAATGSTPATQRTFSITIPSSLTVLTTTFPAGSAGVPYSQGLSASGGVPPYSWSIIGGNLPPGLGIQNGTSPAVVGTPTATGTFNFTLNVSDSLGNGSFVQTSIVIGATPSGPLITTTSVPNGIVGIAYNTQLACINCAGYTWSLTSGVLPLGLSLSSGGSISGTPSTAGSASFQVTISSSQFGTSAQSSASQVYTMIINGSGLGIVQSTIPIGFAGTPYSTTLTGTGGLAPYTWSLTSPASSNDGLTIKSSTGALTGSPTATGTFILSVTLADSSGLTVTNQFTLSVYTALSVATTSLPNGTVGTVYPQQTLQATGGQPSYHWSITVGTLPPGLTLNSATGAITGTPTSGGSYSFTVSVTDNQSNTATAKLSITISGTTITITPATLPAGTVGTAYTQALTATGGTAPYTWSTTAGALPAGLTLSSSGTITGTPTAAATSSFTVQAIDANQATGTQALSITIAAPPLTITTASLGNGTVSAAYAQTLAASGGTPPYTWSLSSGTLPAGLTLNASTGAISGTPTAAGTSNITVLVTDSAKNTATKSLSLVVSTQLTVTALTLPAGMVGVAYSAPLPLTVTGGTPPYSYSLSPTNTSGATINSDGLTMNATTGAISGTPTAAGSFTLTIVVTDSSSPNQKSAQNVTIAVNAAKITIAPSTLPAATVGTAYSQALTASGGAAPYQFTVTSGTLPGGLSLSTGGTISGTATATGSGTFTITATDSFGAIGSLAYTLAVNAPTAPTVTLTGVPATSGFQQQLAITPTISSTYPSAVTGTVTLTFTPSVTPPAGTTGTIDDAMIQFSGGGRTATFTISAGSTTAGNLTVLTGTTAGTITLTTTLSANGATLGSPTTQTILNAPGVPFISKVVLKQASGGVVVVVTGFSSTRDLINASFAFAPATGDTFTSNNVSVPVQTPFNTWWSNTTQSNPYGTQFTLTVPFTLATATQSVTNVVVVSVTVTLQNSKGASNPVTISQ